MKYEEGNIVLLTDGRTVCIFTTNEVTREYHVVDTNDENRIDTISESDIYMLVT